MVDRPRRLRREYEVRLARAKGKSVADGALVARIRRDARPGQSNRYAVVAGKKVGGAVARNRLKRLVREAIRALDPSFTGGHDIVLILRGGVAELPSSTVAMTLLQRIARRAGLLGERERSSAVDLAPQDSATATSTPATVRV